MYHQFDPLDGFRVLFGDGEAVFPKRSLPLGASVIDFMNLDPDELSRLDKAAQTLLFEMNAYLIGELDASQAAFTNKALKDFFSLLLKFPVYRELNLGRIPNLSLYREFPDVRERMITEGTDEYENTQLWLKNLAELKDSIYWFQQKTEAIMGTAFARVSERNASGYAKCLAEYYDHIDMEIEYLSGLFDDEVEEGGDYEELREKYLKGIDQSYFPFFFPVKIRYRTVPHPQKKDAYLLAEEVLFPDLKTFLSMDLMRGFAVGHLPRRCAHCGKWFLLESGYDTRYCENPAPDEPDKTCRQVGAHRKEARLNGTDEIRAEYKRVTNRLKGRKYSGSLTTDEWNNWMRIVQDLRQEAEAGRIKVAELRERYDGICNHRRK